MKQLLRYTSTLLRTALLLGVLALVNTQESQAQTDAQRAAMPDGFETINNPVKDEWYYIQFNINGMYPFLGEFGEGAVMRSRDYMPFSKNIQWALEDAGFNSDETPKQLYRLKSKNGFYVCSDGNNFISSKTQTPTLFQLKGRGSLLIPGYYELTVDGTRQSLSRGNSNDEWTDIVRNGDNNRANLFRFAKLKPTAAHIIYYRQEHADGNNNSSANVETTRHYLTYSETGEETDSRDNYDIWIWRNSKVSSRLSIIPKDKSLWSLPTAAAYHQDGLWVLEETGTNGDFYIKKYGTEEYLNGVDASWGYYSDLSTKDEEFGKYSLESPDANRYTRILTKNTLDADMFYMWNYNVSDPKNSTRSNPANAESHFNESLSGNGLVIGWGTVAYTVFADLTDYTKMIIKGTPGMQLRVLLNRLEVGNGGGDGNGGAIVELNPVIGNDGTVELDLSQISSSYIHLNAIKTGYSSTGTVSAITLERPDKRIPRHLNSAHGDGWYALQWHEDNADDWSAGFYPVEVPKSLKDEYFEVLVGIPVVDGNPMLNYNGGATWPYSEDEDKRILWKLEQEDDYKHFRLKHPTNGRYLSGVDKMTQPNDPDGALPTDIGGGEVEYRKAETNDNKKFWGDFTLKWFYVDPATLAQKEILVNTLMVTHKESYLKAYADEEVIANQEGLRKQGLTKNIQSDWWNFGEDNNDPLKGTQKTNHFEITHYVKKGDTKIVGLPTVLNHNNDHVLYQRWYNFNNDEDIEGLKSHVSLDTRDDGDVQYFLYKNGMVTGEWLDWTQNGSDIPNGGMARFARRNFNFTNSDGQRFTVAADVSRYSDFQYENSSSHYAGNLKEPSLTMRYLFHMRDAKEMADSLTQCLMSDDSSNPNPKWLEEKEIHFGRTQVPYTKFKKVGYRGEFIGIRHLFSDYWVYDNPNLITRNTDGELVVNTTYIEDTYGAQENINDFLDQHLVSAVNNNESGKIKVEIDAGNTGIRLGGYNAYIESNITNGLNSETYDDSSDDESNYQGFYFYDKLSPNPKTEYGNSRFVVFRYPAGGIVQQCGPTNPAYLKVYLEYDNKKYQIARFKLIFDAEMATRPWTEIKNGTIFANGVNKVKGTNRDPKQLRTQAGLPIAKITFDFPEKMNLSGSEVNATYHYLSEYDSHSTNGNTRHNGGNNAPGGTITYYNNLNDKTEYSSPLPLTFDHTNYAFDGDGCNWGSYAIVTGKRTTWGNDRIVEPADDDTYGYGLPADDGMQKAFLYIDASEQPGDICAVDFEGEFCANDELMCTGWISGSNKIQGDTRCPGSITLTVKGGNADGSNTNTIYRFCPGQIYELDNGYGDNGNGNATAAENYAGIDGNLNDATHVVWQQFFFKFSTDKKYERYWLEVNNNCVSSNGGDFMLDNVEVYAMVPEVIPEINTPLCVKRDANNNIVYDMQFLKLKVDYSKLSSSSPEDPAHPDATPYLGFVFLDKNKFLTKLREELGLTNSISLEDLAKRVETGYYDNEIDGSNVHYQNAFDAALLRTEGNTNIWTTDNLTANQGAGVMYFEWSRTFNDMEQYSFYKAVNKEYATFRDTEGGEPYIIFNGNYPQLPWKTNTDYYIVPSNTKITSFADVYTAFNICSQCSKASVFKIDPPYTILGLEKSETTNDYVVCEGQVPTLLTDLKGYDFEGIEVPMNDLNYDWWLGDLSDSEHPLFATLENYHAQHKTIDNEDVHLDIALSSMRWFYPEITSLDGLLDKHQTNPSHDLTVPMIKYLQELVDKGQLVLHQKSISVPAEPTGPEEPYFYIVACPIHDEYFNQALNPGKNAVNNGSMEHDDASSFWMGGPNITGKQTVTFTEGIGKDGTKGVTISSSGTENQEWDTQFFIRANDVLPVGTTFHLEFDYKASRQVSIGTQAHSEPGNYNYWACIGDIDFTTEWQRFSQDITVSDQMGNGDNGSKGNSFQTIAFNLGKTGSEVTYYFDNVSLIPNYYVAYFCDEPQGLRIKVGEKAPTLKTGFVPNENGFAEYNYPTNSNPVLSIRLAKKEQFETVRHGTVNDAPTETYNTDADNAKHFLWLPIRNAKTQVANGIIRKSADYNVYLASTNDPVWDKKIAADMKKNGSLPIFGKIVQLYAKNTNGANDAETYTLEHAQNGVNRLCIYFVEYEDEQYNVREGYNYTLSLPFQEVPDGEGNDVNTCDGTILINLKIVPDYEVWTGAAGNTDWNNDENWRRADGNTAYTTTSSELNSDELYVANAVVPDPANNIKGSPLYGYTTNKTNYRSAKDRLLRKGFAPLYCTHVLIKSDEWGNAPVLYDAIDGKSVNPVTGSRLTSSPFPNLRDEDGWDGSTGNNATKATATPILRYDMQARHHELWTETYGQTANWGRDGDLLAEMYQINSCDEIAFQPGTELMNAHLLNYNSAWMEYQLENKRWYLLGSPLQGTISGEWYAPKKTAQQKTTYYDPVTFTKYIPVTITSDNTPNPVECGYYILRSSDKKYVPTTDTSPVDGTIYYKKTETTAYDRYNPAIYQRSWDRAKAVLYEVGSTYSTTDDSQTGNLGHSWEGSWDNGTWTDPAGQDDGTGADEYLDRLGYKPMGGNKANVAIKGIWSNTYNDAQVDYAAGGFSVMVMNHLKGNENDESGDKSIIRLPKEDTMYDYYEFNQTNEYDGGTDTELSDVRGKNRAKNRGRLKTDLLLPESTHKTESAASIYGDARTYTRIPFKESELETMNNSFLPSFGDGGWQDPEAGFFTESVPAGASNLGYYLVENPFQCGLNMDAFFEANKSVLQQKYWLITADGQHLVQKAADQDPSEWISPTISTADGDLFATANRVVAPGQGFFVQAKTATNESITITFNKDMQAQTRYGVQSGNPRTFTIEVGQRQDVEDKVIDIDINGNDILGETYVEDGQTIVEQETVQVPKYQKENGEYVLDEEGNKIPVLIPITQDIEIYDYVQTSDNDYKYPLLSRRTRGGASSLSGLVITAQRGNDQSSALVMKREKASNDFLPSEDTETFISSEDLKQVPMVYTLCGRLATTINSIHDFRSLPLGVESASDAPCTLTFQGVELLGDSIAFYDAKEKKLTPLESGMTFEVSGQTQNRYYLVSTLIQEEAAVETHLQIFNEGLTTRVIASTEESIVYVRCFDLSGQLIHTAEPQSQEYVFRLPTAGVYVIEAQTENDRKTKKVMAK